MSWHNDSAILHYNQREDDLAWDDDDAILHFDPDKQDQLLPKKPPPPIDTSTSLNQVPSTVQGPAGSGRKRKAAQPRPRKRKSGEQPNDPSQSREVEDGEFKSRMLDAIRGDDELYHRILRYDVRFLRFHTLGIVQLTNVYCSRFPSRTLWVWQWL